MKESLKYLSITLIVICSLCSCSRGRWLYEPVNGDTKTVSNSLKDFLSLNRKLKVVLRVPNEPKEITHSESVAPLYGFLEELLLQHGFIVRDRLLLQRIQEGGIVSYTDLGKKIDTDLIIEVIYFDLNYECAKGAYWINEDTGTKTYYPDIAQYCVVLECRVILVRNGEIGGIFRFRESYFDNESNIVYNQETGKYENLPSYSQKRDLAVKIFRRFVNVLLNKPNEERKRYKSKDLQKTDGEKAGVEDIPKNVRDIVLKEISMDDLKEVLRDMDKDAARRLTAESVRAIYNFNQGMRKK